jgi:hypothetical protein
MWVFNRMFIFNCSTFTVTDLMKPIEVRWHTWLYHTISPGTRQMICCIEASTSFFIFILENSRYTSFFSSSSAVLSFLLTSACLFCRNCHTFRYHQYILNTDRISFQFLRIHFCSLDHAFSNYDEIKPKKCIFKLR